MTSPHVDRGPWCCEHASPLGARGAHRAGSWP
jgi:hypothetical protein